MSSPVNQKKERVGPAHLIEDFAATSPAILERITFEGLEKSGGFKTKRDALVKETEELFRAKTLKDLIVKANQAKQHLEHVGLFTSVGVVVDIDRQNKHGDNGYEVKFLVKEPRYPTGRIGVDVSSNGEAVSTLRSQYMNAFGRAEGFSAQKIFGYNHSSLFNLGFTKPLLGWQRYSGLNLQAFRNYEEAGWSKYSNMETGVSAELHYKPRHFLTHHLRWIGSWRNVNCLSNDASFDVRMQSGHTLKSSIQSELEYSTLSHPAIAEKGLSLRLIQEIAGLGGDVKFLRHNLDFKSSTKLLGGIILSTGFQASYIHPMSGPTLPIVDRSFLGGPSNLRGFRLNSVGPESDLCYLGGMSSWCAGIHLYRSIEPKKYDFNLIFAHAFCVAGNIHGVETGSDPADIIRRLVTNPRVSIGLGIAIRLFGLGQLELNYCIPLQFRATDKQQPGFQIGVGVNYV